MIARHPSDHPMRELLTSLGALDRQGPLRSAA